MREISLDHIIYISAGYIKYDKNLKHQQLPKPQYKYSNDHQNDHQYADEVDSYKKDRCSSPGPMCSS